MDSFEKVLAEGTARGANEVPGCVLGAVDKHGRRRPSTLPQRLVAKMLSYSRG